MLILNILYVWLDTVVSNLGLPLALSVFGLIKLPGGYMVGGLLCLSVFV